MMEVARREFLRLVLMYELFMDDDDDEDEMQWEKVTVDVDEYRMGDPSFSKHFRVSKKVFEELLLDVKDHLVQAGRFQRERTDFAHIMLTVLWVLATPDTFRSVALRFGFHPGTVHEFYVYIIEAMRELAPRFIKWPNELERLQTKRILRNKSGFGGIVGIIDVCKIPISAPLEEPAAYRDYKLQHSLSVQVVCDHRYCVIDAYLGEAGSLHDQRVFRRSPLFLNLLQRPDLMNADEHIIGDGAYLLLDRVMKPFDNNGHLTRRQINFNRRLSTVRCRIEHTFAHWKSLWRRLHYFPVKNMDYALDHLAATLFLHNYRIMRGERHVLDADAAYFDNVYEEPVILERDDQEREDLADLIHDPFVPHAGMVELLANAQMRGDQKRWDICNNLPLEV